MGINDALVSEIPAVSSMSAAPTFGTEKIRTQDDGTLRHGL